MKWGDPIDPWYFWLFAWGFTGLVYGVVLLLKH